MTRHRNDVGTIVQRHADSCADIPQSQISAVGFGLIEPQAQRDKGLAVGGVQVGVWGWSFGSYFPGALPYLLMHHPELARFEAPYSLPLLFNEDEWRNGTQTGFAPLMIASGP